MLRGLRIGQLAHRAGVPRATIQFYLREGLLPSPVKTGKTMAYYDPACVERIRVIKELQRRYLPLNVIRRMLRDGPRAARRGGLGAMEEAGRRIRAALEPHERTMSREDLVAVTGIAPEALAALEKLGMVAAERDVFGPFDVSIVRAVGKLRPLGLDERIGFRADDLAIYRDAMADLVAKEVATFSRSVVGRREPSDVVKLGIAAAAGATEVIVAIRNKLVADFVASGLPRPRKRRGGRRGR